MSNNWSAVGQLSPTFSQEPLCDVCCGPSCGGGATVTHSEAVLMILSHLTLILQPFILSFICTFHSKQSVKVFSVTLFRAYHKSWTVCCDPRRFLTLGKYCGNLSLVWRALYLESCCCILICYLYVIFLFELFFWVRWHRLAVSTLKYPQQLSLSLLG